MAGGRGEGRSRLTLAERLEVTRETAHHARGGTQPGPVPLHGSPEGLRRPPGPDPMAVIPYSAPEPPVPDDYRQPADGPQHVWVTTDDDGVVPALLVEWRRPDGATSWEGRVFRAARHGAGWRLVEEWRDRSSIRPT